MKPYWGKKSLINRATLHGDLIKVLDAVLEESTMEEDFAIICGVRGASAQALALASGNSYVPYPESHHNGTYDENGKWVDTISDAVDVVPSPIEWPSAADLPHEYARKMKRFYDLAERILTKAFELEIELEWGGMFKKFFDGPHFQRRR